MPEIEHRQRRLRRPILTDRMVAELPRKPKPYFHPDPELPKHGIRVRPTGPGAYTVITRDPYGKQKWVKVGSTAEMLIAPARDVARTVIKRLEAGLAAFEEPPLKPESVASVAEAWLQRHVAKNKLRRGNEVRRIIAKYILPHVGDRIFVDLRRKDIAALLDHIEDHHSPHVADAARTVLRQLASWVQSRDDDYVPPFTKGMRRVSSEARKRSRMLDDGELRRIWIAAGNAGTFGNFVRTLLLTAQRFDKVRTMRWDDIGADGVWTIRTAPREKGNAGTLQLPGLALEILAAQPRFAGNPHVFAGRGAAAFSTGSFHKEKLDAQSGVSAWRLHDLRRTSRSLMSRTGVLSEHAERVLGHAAGNIEQIYNRHSYDAEKADALRKLAALVERIVNPPADNVVTLHHEAAS